MSKAWTRIDVRMAYGVSNLDPEDNCFYLMEYTKGGWDKSDANQKIANFKKDMDRKNKKEWWYKGEAIRNFSDDLSGFLIGSAFTRRTTLLVAMPTSNMRSSKDYDDRIIQTLQLVNAKTGLRCIDPFDPIRDAPASHLGGTRDPEVIRRNLVLNSSAEALKDFEVCLLVDDVITSGAHYVACRTMVEERFPHLQVAGLFWAKTAKAGT